jgi:hypothetical protein
VRDTTIKDFADVLRVPVERLLVQMREAGLSHLDERSIVSDNDKMVLLDHLRRLHAPAPPLPRKTIPARRRDRRNDADIAVTRSHHAVSEAAPRLFISYSWDCPDHMAWVKSFATDLRHNGVDAVLDKWELHPGDPIAEWMEQSIATSDFVALICTPNYKLKADGRKGGVGYEGSIITGELFQRANHRKFIPILRGPSWMSCAPLYLHTKFYIDLRKNADKESELRNLLLTLFRRRESAPPIGARPNLG